MVNHYKQNSKSEDRNEKWLNGEYKHYKRCNWRRLVFYFKDGKVTGRTFNRIRKESGMKKLK